jgi:hypothetical protein
LNISAMVAGAAANRLMELMVIARAAMTPMKKGESWSDVLDRTMAEMGQERGDAAMGRRAQAKSKASGEGGAVKAKQATESLTGAEVKRSDVLSDLLTKLEKERELTREQGSTLEQRKEAHLQTIAELQELINAAVKHGDDVVTASLLISREQHTREIASLESTIAEKKRDQEKTEARLRNAQNGKIADLQTEMKVLELRNAGHRRAADAVEREARLRKDAAEIAQETGLSDAKALEIARRRQELMDRADRHERGADRPGGRGRIQGYSQGQDSFGNSRNPFRNLGEATFGHSRKFRPPTPGLDELHRLNSLEERGGVLVRPTAFPVRIKQSGNASKAVDLTRVERSLQNIEAELKG